MSATWNKQIVESLMAYKKGVDEAVSKAHMRGTKLRHSPNPDERKVREYFHLAVVMAHISIAIAEYVAKKIKPADGEENAS